jgi:putative Mg2+ transporter-C (MgtC) family protein
MHGFLVTIPAGSFGDFTGRAIIAVVLGAIIGLERQWRQRMAGLRTNALVALGAALFELLAVLMANQHDGVNIRGINTAATIWCSAAVGVLSGAGYVLEAVVGAALVVLAHLLLRPVARRVDRLPATGDSEVETIYRFSAICTAADEAHIRALVVQALTRDEFVLRAVRSEDLDAGKGLVEVTAELQRFGRDDLEAAVSRLSLEPSVSSVSWSVLEPAALLAGEE